MSRKPDSCFKVWRLTMKFEKYGPDRAQVIRLIKWTWSLINAGKRLSNVPMY